MKQIPLAERLSRIAETAGEPYNCPAFRIFLDHYFSGMAELTGNPHYVTNYENNIAPNFKDGIEVLARYVEQVWTQYGETFLDEDMDRLFQVIIDPFAELELQAKTEREEHECKDLIF